MNKLTEVELNKHLVGANTWQRDGILGHITAQQQRIEELEAELKSSEQAHDEEAKNWQNEFESLQAELRRKDTTRPTDELLREAMELLELVPCKCGITDDTDYCSQTKAIALINRINQHLGGANES